MENKTIRLFDQNAYQTEFCGNIIDCCPAGEGFEVLLNQTLFFPEEAGQCADGGTLDGLPVLDVQNRNGLIYHLIPSPLPANREIKGVIDWELRYSNMQQHTGEHIMSGLIHQQFGCDNVGFHLGTSAVTLDFNRFLEPEEVERIETLANEAVFQNLPVLAEYPPADVLTGLSYRSKIALTEEVRIVTIPGIDRCACCAPHVKNTGEIGLIKVVDTEKYKGGIRISILCGRRALLDYRTGQKQLEELSVLLSAKKEAASQAVSRLMNELFETKGQLNRMMDQWIVTKADAQPFSQEIICLFEDNMEPQLHRKYVNLLLPKCSQFTAVFSGSEAEGYRYIIASHGSDLRPMAKSLADHFESRGGGSAAMIQGSISAKKDELEAFFSSARSCQAALFDPPS